MVHSRMLKEGLPYRQGYLEDVALLADVNLEQVLEWAAQMDTELQARPGDFGWRFDGKIVAPACVTHTFASCLSLEWFSTK